MKRDVIDSIIISVFTLYLFIYSMYSGIIYIFSNSLYPAEYQSFFVFIPYIMLPLLSIWKNNKMIERVYVYFMFLGFVSFIILLTTYIYEPMLEILDIVIIAFYTDVLDQYFQNNRNLFYRGVTFVAIFFIMFSIARFFVYVPATDPSRIVIDSIYADYARSQVPFFFYYGIIIRIAYINITTSIQAIILYIVLSVLLAENYFLIFGIVKGNSTASMINPTLTGGISALSCQCEGLTATLPTVAAVVASVISEALLTESIVLLIMSNIILNIFLNKRSRITLVSSVKNIRDSNIFPVLALFFVLVFPVAETIGIIFKLEKTSMLFFFGMNLLTFISGIFLIYGIYRIGINIKISNIVNKGIYIFIASFIMFIWFIPGMALYAYTDYGIFILMNIISLISGIITYIVYINIEELKRAYVEFISMMFSMTGLVIFYISTISKITIYPEFGIAQQLYFAAMLWAVSLPFMWLSTIDTMYMYSIPRDAIKNKNKSNKTVVSD
ncbi:hypothetical protein [Picrophilus oshimae]|uniref:Uncharacterized protein n=1 Tax=Picrophilus torridus (strain ATCC 700027 / DSM 9790 / JCM 10055 / NBRC 100828 / KAW 2/3) TaxID=1122961 RepID=A0A8G2L7E9_PICTO|nr:hypothetical protein [Picrophilus oshimae]SMD31047.1 hypothetical protein SAMN02745355_0966 [Picrophilus oshimae DSM 9789]